MVVVMTPPRRPLVLDRKWCLYEMANSVDVGQRCTVLCPPGDDIDSLARTLAAAPSATVRRVCKVSTEHQSVSVSASCAAVKATH
jgi:hypothetical protein